MASVNATEVKSDRYYTCEQQYLKLQASAGQQPLVNLTCRAIPKMLLTQYQDTNAIVMLEGDQFSLWLSTECHYAKFIDQTKAITHDRNIVTCVTVEVCLSLVLCSASFQIKTLLMTVFLPSSSSVWTTSDKCLCLLIHVLYSPQRLLPTDFMKKCFSGLHSTAFWGCLILWAWFPLGICLAAGRWWWGSLSAGEQMTSSGCAVCSSMLQGSQTELLLTGVSRPLAFWGLL